MPNRLKHTVVFWLQPESAAETADSMAEFYRGKITKVAGVEEVQVGRPVNSERDVVDDSYDLMTFVTFTDEASAASWQTDPVHDEFRNRFESHFARVVVYDSKLHD